MMSPPDEAELGPDPDGDLRTFQLVAEGLTQLVGFEAALVNLVDGDELVVVAVGGVGEGMRPDGTVETAEQMIGTRWKRSALDTELAVADDWGRFKFVHHDRVTLAEGSYWLSTSPARKDGPDAWHPLDVLVAPIYDGAGELCGAVTLDEPLSGRYPTPAQLRMMDKYVDLAAHAITNAIERQRLAEQARLLKAARVVVRQATAQHSMRAVLAETGETLRQAFAADAVWIRILASEGEAKSYVRHFAERPVAYDPAMSGIGERTARRMWEQDSVAVLDTRTTSATDAMTEDRRRARDYLERNGYSAVLHLPLGAGPECLGALSIVRAVGAPPFTQVEVNAVRDIGLDLGRMLLNARNLERERRVIRQLRDLDSFKTGLIARVADELSTPLAAIISDAVPLHRDAPPDPAVVSRLHANARRMAQMADDLLLLARTGDQDVSQAPATRVDLASLVTSAVDRVEPNVPPRVRVVVPPRPVLVAGDADELEQVVGALLANARAYTPDDCEVTVRLDEHDPDVVLTVADTGIGIAADDLDRVFDEFFRSDDPRVRAQPGTGLGLSIVDRVVRRHGGRVEVESAPGRGSTFSVHLPATEITDVSR